MPSGGPLPAPPAWAPPPNPGPGWGGQPPGTPGWGDPSWGAGGWGDPDQLPTRPTGGNARTGPLPLSPMGIGEILDGAFKLYRANFKSIALVALVFVGPAMVIASVAVRDVNGGLGLLDIMSDPSLVEDSDSFGGSGQTLLQFLPPALLWLISPMVAGVVAKAVSASYLGGQLSAGQAVRAIGPLGFFFLLLAKLMVGATELLGAIGCCVGLVFVMALWVVVSPAMVVEGLGPIRGMRRSLRLCTGRYWPVLGVALLSGLITTTLSSVVGGLPGLAAAVIGYRWGFPLVAIGNTATAVLVEPLSAIVATLVYFDLRIRQEGFDLQIMARDLGAGAASTG